MYLTNLTPHAQRVLAFMFRANQSPPPTPTMPDEKTRILRAKLIFEEAMETINALGVTVSVPARGPDASPDPISVNEAPHFFDATHEPCFDEIVDGCADVSVVTIGTLLACGVEDAPILELVDQNNLAKFGPGHSYREDGKLVKPPGHKPPDILKALLRQEPGWPFFDAPVPSTPR